MPNVPFEQQLFTEQLAQKSADEIIFALAQAITGHPFPQYEAVNPAVTEKARAALENYIKALRQYRENHPMD